MKKWDQENDICVEINTGGRTKGNEYTVKEQKTREIDEKQMRKLNKGLQANTEHDKRK